MCAGSSPAAGSSKPPASSAAVMRAGQLQQRERVAAGLGDDPVSDAAVEPAGDDARQQRAGILLGQPFEAAARAARRSRARSSRLAHGDHDRHRLGPHASRDEAEDLARGGIQPLRVLDEAEQRALLRHGRQQAEHGQSDEEPLRHRPTRRPTRPRARSAAVRRAPGARRAAVCTTDGSPRTRAPSPPGRLRPRRRAGPMPAARRNAAARSFRCPAHHGSPGPRSGRGGPGRASHRGDGTRVSGRGTDPPHCRHRATLGTSPRGLNRCSAAATCRDRAALLGTRSTVMPRSRNCDATSGAISSGAEVMTIAPRGRTCRAACRQSRAALFDVVWTTTSTPPNSAIDSVNSRWTSRSSARSARTAIVVPPAAMISAIVASACD